MIEAGQEFRQVAAVLGCTAEILEQYLRTDPDAAEREKDSLSFQQFKSEQFGAAQNYNGQKNGVTEKRGRGRQRGYKLIDVKQALTDIQAKVIELKEAGFHRGNLTAKLVAAKLFIGSDATGGSTMMERVKKCEVELKWPELRDFFWDGGNLSELKFKS